MKFMCPLVVVKDINRSRDFYENVLGQTLKYDFGENITFVGDFALHQEDHFKSLINQARLIKKSNSFELYFEDDRLEDLLVRLKELNIEFLHGIIEQPWKQQVFRFYDYDKNLIEVGERMEHVAYRVYQQDYSIEEICKITYLDQKRVEMSIQEYNQSF